MEYTYLYDNQLSVITEYVSKSLKYVLNIIILPHYFSHPSNNMLGMQRE